MLVVAIVLIAASVFIFYRNADFKKNGKIATATITNIDGYYFGDDYEYDVYVRFTVDGEDITGKLDVYKSSFYVGQVIEVIYKTDNPHNFIYRGYNNVLPFILLVAGVVVLCLGVVPIIINILRKRKIALFKKQGEILHGVIKKIEYNQKLRINGNCIATVSVIDDRGMLYEKKMSFHPGEIKEGDAVTIYRSFENENDFVLDL